MRTNVSLKIRLILTAGICSIVTAAYGQDASAPDGALDQIADVAVLDTIIVSARKFEEPIQHVPFSIDALSSAQLDDAGIEKIEDLSRWIPNFNFSDSGLSFANTMNLRGIGSSSALIAPSVNYYVDGVPVPVRVFDQRFFDVKSIEVLKGPQGTLFGLNSQAGAVVIKTEEATADLSAGLATEIGSYGNREVSGYLNGAISERVTARVSGELHGYDGDIRNFSFSAPNLVSNDDRSVREEYFGALSAKVSAEISDTTDATLSVRYNRNDTRPTTGVWIDDPNLPRNSYNPVPKSTIDTIGSSLEIQHDLDYATLTSLTGLSYYQIDFEADLLDGFIISEQSGFPASAFQTIGLNVRQMDEDNTQFSQEFRLNGDIGTDGQWVAGVSGFYSDFESTTDITSQFIANGAYTGDLNKTNLAAFGEVTIPVGEKLRLIGGARYTYESQDFSGNYVARPSGAVFNEEHDSSFNFVTGRAGVGYDVMPELTVYGTIARGEKPGGYLFFNQFASLGIPLTEYESSSTWTYEAGLRGQPGIEWLHLAGSVFFNDTADEQLFTFNPISGRFDVQNADTESYGVELSVVAEPIENLQFGANVGLLRAEITGGVNTTLKGNDVPYAPNLTAALFAEYRHQIDAGILTGDLFGRVEYTHTGSRQIDPANNRELKAYDLVNLRAGWQKEDLEIYGYVENLFDKSYTTSAYLTGTNSSGQNVFAGIPGKGRAFGVGARVKF
ncbi:TonB-dependent receptor [Labrenzia sp. CE80]|uniref:TonB-dependent receptor n=1 Tax=Labrenzia sp. CE80 TaxID=1788986 RepID=UPI00129A9DBE|nr:TonB-dependent receptor [Labrenzia sp. CE80]